MHCRKSIAALAASVALSVPCVAQGAAMADNPAVVAIVDRATQELHVSVNGVEIYAWPVSTGRKLSWTPVGTYGALTPQTEAYVRYRSHKIYCDRSIRTGKKRCYHASMPYAVFFDAGRAIHAATPDEYAKLGTPASHGCVRLSLEHAQTFFELVKTYGKERTSIVVK